jgi:3-hydroxypropanoate dehydrogenase
MRELDDAALDLIFRQARTHSHWLDRDVPDDLLRRAYELARMGPTSANCQPMRVVFVRSAEAKARFAPALSKGNLAKTMAAPATAIFAMDLEFYEILPRVFHDPEARSWFAGKPKTIESTAFRNATLQAAYFIFAARSLGLDCGPMSGFDNAGVDKEFFPDGRVKSNFICSFGYGDPAGLFERSPRFAFDEIAKIL